MNWVQKGLRRAGKEINKFEEIPFTSSIPECSQVNTALNHSPCPLCALYYKARVTMSKGCHGNSCILLSG